MARRFRLRSLGWLAIGFTLAATAAWTLAVALARGLVPARRGLPALSRLAPHLTAAAILTVTAFLAFRGAEKGLERRDRDGAARALRRAEPVATFAILALLALTVFLDASATLVGAGLIGLGLALALQRPILALAGWVYLTLNRPFREGDRIEVQGVVGDVLEIGPLATQLWELGRPGTRLDENVEQTRARPTGRTVTITNAVFMEEPVANAMRDVEYVFDEFVVAVAYEADRELAHELLASVGEEVIDDRVHEQAARRYERLTRGTPMQPHFPRQPVVRESLTESWIELRLRYLVDARERETTRKQLSEGWLRRVREHRDELPVVYPRNQEMQLDADGRVVGGGDAKTACRSP